jgi:hypothetical protein
MNEKLGESYFRPRVRNGGHGFAAIPFAFSILGSDGRVFGFMVKLFSFW